MLNLLAYVAKKQFSDWLHGNTISKAEREKNIALRNQAYNEFLQMCKEADEQEATRMTQFQKPMKNASRVYHSKIAGVTYDNRQLYVSKLKPGQYLQVIRERFNSYDRNAVALSDGEHTLGHLKQEMASLAASALDAGRTVNVKVVEVTGGGNYNYGVNIQVMIEQAPQASFNKNTAAGMAAGAATGYAASHYHSDSKYDVVDLGYDYHDVEVDDETRDAQMEEEDNYGDW